MCYKVWQFKGNKLLKHCNETQQGDHHLEIQDWKLFNAFGIIRFSGTPQQTPSYLLYVVKTKKLYFKSKNFDLTNGIFYKKHF